MRSCAEITLWTTTPRRGLRAFTVPGLVVSGPGKVPVGRPAPASLPACPFCGSFSVNREVDVKSLERNRGQQVSLPLDVEAQWAKVSEGQGAAWVCRHQQDLGEELRDKGHALWGSSRPSSHGRPAPRRQRLSAACVCLVSGTGVSRNRFLWLNSFGSRWAKQRSVAVFAIGCKFPGQGRGLRH